MVTAPGMVAPEMGIVKHPHWVHTLGLHLEDIDADLAKKDLPAAARHDLEKARSQLEEIRALAGANCERHAIWSNQQVCPLVLRGGMRSTGLLLKRPGYAVTDLSAKHALYRPGEQAFEEGIFRGPLAVLTDADTVSAAELFAATLRDNGRARLIGTLTRGAGCGYTDGGIELTLENSRGELKVPDCMRFRSDGSNEVVGLDPDIMVSWRGNLSAYQKAQRMRAGLERWAEAIK